MQTFQFSEGHFLSIHHIQLYLFSSLMRPRYARQTPQIQPAVEQQTLTKQQKVKKQLSTIEQKISTKLENNQIAIAKKKIPFLNQKQKQTHENVAYEKLLQQKKRMQQKMKLLQNTQKLYMSKSRETQKSRISPGYQKTQLTEEERNNLKKLKKKLKDFQDSIEKKNKQIQQQVLRMKKQDEERITRERNAANELKKLKIQQKLQQIRQKSIQRENKKRNEDSLLKKIEQKKKLYQLLDESWKQKNNQQQQRKYELMEARLKQKHMDFVDLREHEKKYQSIISEKKKQLQQKRLNSSRVSQNQSEQALHKSKFYAYIVKQEQKAKNQEQLRKQQPKQIRLRRQKYADYVYEEFAPKTKALSDNQSPQKQKEQSPKIIRLTKQQIKQIGNTYLQNGNKKAKKKQNISNTITVTSDLQKSKSNSGSKNTASTISHYPDYLRDARQKKVEHNYYSGFYNSPRSEAQKIMKSDKIKKQDKIAKIKLLATRFDSNSTDIIAKIQGKLQILQVIN